MARVSSASPSSRTVTGCAKRRAISRPSSPAATTSPSCAGASPLLPRLGPERGSAALTGTSPSQPFGFDFAHPRPYVPTLVEEHGNEDRQFTEVAEETR